MKSQEADRQYYFDGRVIEVRGGKIVDGPWPIDWPVQFHVRGTTGGLPQAGSRRDKKGGKKPILVVCLKDDQPSS